MNAPGDPRTDDDARDRDEIEPLGRPARSLAGLSVAGITRRRLASIVALVVAGWILLTFARQVGEAADAATRAERAQAENTALSAQLDRLREELAFIQEPRFVALQARAYGIGGRHERPFTLAADAPALAADAPGSASQRVGYRPATRTPLEAWMSLLFGTTTSR